MNCTRPLYDGAIPHRPKGAMGSRMHCSWRYEGAAGAYASLRKNIGLGLGYRAFVVNHFPVTILIGSVSNQLLLIL